MILGANDEQRSDRQGTTQNEQRHDSGLGDADCQPDAQRGNIPSSEKTVTEGAAKPGS